MVRRCPGACTIGRAKRAASKPPISPPIWPRWANRRPTPAAPLDDDHWPQAEQLYEDLGCIQCHRFTPPADADEFGRTSLFFTGDKFQPGGLEAYLARPHAGYAWSRMPDFQLAESEVDGLAGIHSQSRRPERLPRHVARAPTRPAAGNCSKPPAAASVIAWTRRSLWLRRVVPVFGRPTRRAAVWPTTRPPAARRPIFAWPMPIASRCVLFCALARPICCTTRRPRFRSG